MDAPGAPAQLRVPAVRPRRPAGVTSRLVGHSGTAVTEEVYRKQIRPVIRTGTVVMDGIFGADPQRS
ncbi:hypothetical protein GCM10010503_44230 [Streptomyces lucensis JCM 4490]|uniref:Uncharacterized protein n=1 Tax=Streptomyces lucensis JCM 4490 TaxID=1306176 RepID=A0A918J944_9ACTN|nr:hypothetical protein GCM10010503_44230 [Streptomyces lucensis JCM 4490]